MATTNPSLFGMLGDEAAMQRQLDEAQATKFAELSPEQRYAYMGSKAGSAAAQGIGALFGLDVTDPAVRQASQIRQLASQFNTTTPEGMLQFARAVKDINPNMANQAAQQAQAMQLKQAEIAQKTAEKMTPEQRNAEQLSALDIRIKALTPYAKDNPDIQKQLEIFTTQRDRLQALTAKSDGKPSVVGVVEGTRQTVYFDGTQQFVYVKGPEGQPIKQPYYGGVDRSTAKVSATATSGDKGRTAFSEQLGKLDAAKVNEAVTARENAGVQLEIADRIEAMSPTALSGQFANTRLGMVSFLDTLGLTSPKDKQVLLSSQVLTSDSSRLLLATLNNKLGGGISNEDAKRVEAIFPQLETSVEARKELVAIIRRSAHKVIDESTRLEEYARANEGLKGFKPKFTFKNSSISSTSADDLAKLAGGKIVNGVFVKDK